MLLVCYLWHKLVINILLYSTFYHITVILTAINNAMIIGKNVKKNLLQKN